MTYMDTKHGVKKIRSIEETQNTENNEKLVLRLGIFYKLQQVIIYTLSPISDTNISENAAVKPDFENAVKIDEGPPFTKAISENTKAHPHSTRAIERG